jgi:hypothetical protein
MQLSHTLRVASAVFDDPNLVSAAGLVPVLKLAERVGLLALADHHLSVPTDKVVRAGQRAGRGGPGGCQRWVEGGVVGCWDGRRR